MAIQRPDPTPRQTSPYMPDMGPEDYAPPEWRLVQPTSQAHTQNQVPLGSYYCDQTGETAEALDLVILKVQRNRTYWSSDDLNFPACTSDDRVTPRPGGKFPGPCASCEKNGAGCYPGYNLFCVRLDQQLKPEASEMFLLRVNHTSVFPFRKLLSQIHLKHQDTPWAISLRLGSDQRSNDKGTYWVMRPDIIASPLISDANPATYTRNATIKAMADQLAGLEPEALMMVDHDAMTAHRRQPTLADEIAPMSTRGATPTPARVTTPITLAEGEGLVALAKRLGVPGDIVTGFIHNTFGKDRLMQLHTGELAMLAKWLEQEFGQTEDVGGEVGLDGKPIDGLPF
mgnify:CR=1 FL=1